MRSGFTLLELLMVITIISIMLTLSVVIMSGLLGSAKEEATSATIQKIDRLLQQRTEAFERAFNGARRTQYINGTLALLLDPNQDGNRDDDGIFGVRDEVVEILAKKAAFRFEFPQRMDELIVGTPNGDINGNGLPDVIEKAIAIPSAKAQLLADGVAAPSDAQIQGLVDSRWALHVANATPLPPGSKVMEKTESSELLYYTLAAAGSFGAGAVDVDRFTNEEVKDTDGDGLPEFVDAWGEPLRFYRWPTRLIDRNAPKPFQPILTSSVDPTDVDLTSTDIETGGMRKVTSNERLVASLALKGLPPRPSSLPSGAMPRDLLLTDPDDPVGRLYSELERLDGTGGKPLFANEFNEAKYHTPETFHTPLIVSAGPDGVLGVYEPIDTVHLGHVAAIDGTLSAAAVIDAMIDNLTNRSKRIGGRN